MKNDIHPKYYTKAKIICACGNEFETGSTVEEIKTELCSICHPFYTGKQKLVDSARRVEKFEARIAATKDTAVARRGKKAKRIARDKTRSEKKEITVKATPEVKSKAKAKKTGKK